MSRGQARGKGWFLFLANTGLHSHALCRAGLITECLSAHLVHARARSDAAQYCAKTPFFRGGRFDCGELRWSLEGFYAEGFAI